MHVLVFPVYTWSNTTCTHLHGTQSNTHAHIHIPIHFVLNLFVNGTKLGKARFDDNIVLKKKAQETYSFTIKADMEDLSSKVGLLFPILMTGKAKVKVKGDVFAKALGMKKKAPIEFIEEISF